MCLDLATPAVDEDFFDKGAEILDDFVKDSFLSEGGCYVVVSVKDLW